MGYDLSSAIHREALSKIITEDVEKGSLEEFEEKEPRRHLGASVIGDSCTFRVWAGWRWLKREKFSGRMHRLFQRGHKEEANFTDRLRYIGFEVYEFDDDNAAEADKGKRQFRISGCDGHFGGSLDSIAYPPERYGLGRVPLLLEYKTHNEKSFAKLAGKVLSRSPDIVRDRKTAMGVRGAKPQHYAQMCSYGRAYGIKYGVYCAVNKETDEFWFEVVELDWSNADDMFRKAEAVVWSQTPLPKISQSPTYWECKFCNLSGICHNQQMPQKNCRSCQFARPIPGGDWHCDRFDDVIPFNFMITGCQDWEPLI